MSSIPTRKGGARGKIPRKSEEGKGMTDFGWKGKRSSLDPRRAKYANVSF